MTRHLRFALIIIALLLPTLSLVALGGVWLWQNGLMLSWALAACLVSLAVYAFEVWALRRPDKLRATGSDAVKQANDAASPTARDGNSDDASAAASGSDVADGGVAEGDAADGTESAELLDADPGWTPREREAWVAVKAVAAAVDPKTLTDRQAFLDLAHLTVERVALTVHPNERDPLLRFTVPEALALVERVSARLRPYFLETIPLGDKITVGQAMRLYEWRSVAGLAQQAYDLWRIIRVMNPATAATQEVRERLSKKFYAWGRDALARKFARRYVEEVGKAAIELYGGRLKVAPDELSTHLSAASKQDRSEIDKRDVEPLRILIAGQTGSGKSSLVNALSKEVQAAVDVLPATKRVTPYALTCDGIPAALLLDSPGLGSPGFGSATGLDDLIAETKNADLLIWVVSATRADREADSQALAKIRASFAAQPDRRAPPVITVMTNIDRLRPFNEWNPPYDFVKGGDQKAQSIRAAQQAIAVDLEIDAAALIPLCLANAAENSDDGGAACSGAYGAYNVDTLWNAVFSRLADAKAAQLLRQLGSAADGFSVKRLGAQLLNAGKEFWRVTAK